MKRLYRDDENNIICGVCAGFADYFKVDPTLVRFIWVILAFINGIGVLLYIIGCVIMPKKSEIDYKAPIYYSSDESKKKLLGFIFIGLGILVILTTTFSRAVWQWIWGFTFIILGIILILKRI